MGRTGQSSGSITWSDGSQKIEVQYRGTVELTDDDSDIKTLSPGGYFRIREGGWFSTRAVEFKADSSGTIGRRYYAGQSEKPFEPEGKAWMSQILPKVIRQTGFGAEARVAQILEAKGPAGVFAEIDTIESSWAKRIYFTELLKHPLDADTVRQALEQAGRQIDSDFELASVLLEVAKRQAVDGVLRAPFFGAVSTIDSSFERGRVLQAVVKRGTLPQETLVSVLRAAQAMGSSFETGQVLQAVAATHTLTGEARNLYVSTAEKLGDFEQGRALTALVKSERR